MYIIIYSQPRALFGFRISPTLRQDENRPADDSKNNDTQYSQFLDKLTNGGGAVWEMTTGAAAAAAWFYCCCCCAFACVDLLRFGSMVHPWKYNGAYEGQSYKNTLNYHPDRRQVH